MTNQIEREDPSKDLGGVDLEKPGQQSTGAKLPKPSVPSGATRGRAEPDQQDPKEELVNPDPASDKLTTAWEDYMVKGFSNNQEMFKKTLEAFMKPYYFTVGMYIVLFIIGVSFFSAAVYLGINNDQSLVAIAFGGLSVATFLAFFIRQPVQALEENLEFITWLGVTFNTYWTRLMYMQNEDTIQADLKAATDDYSNTVERLITKHAELRGKRPGGDPSAAQSETATETKPEQLPAQNQVQPDKPAQSPASSPAPQPDKPEKQSDQGEAEQKPKTV